MIVMKRDVLLVQDYLYLPRVSEGEEKRKVYLRPLYHKLKFYLNIIIYIYNRYSFNYWYLLNNYLYLYCI